MAVSTRGSLSAGRFLGCLVATAAVFFGLVWACMLWCPLMVFGGNHVMWAAKDELLRRCNLGSLVVVGDSRAQVGIIPAMLAERTTSLALGGISTIETYFTVKRMLRCAEHPAQVIVSLTPARFLEADLLWTNGAQVGMLSVGDLREIVQVSQRLHDDTIDRVERANDLRDALRVWLYPMLFPPVNFADMIDGLPFYRYGFNRKVVAAQVAANGYYAFPDRSPRPASLPRTDNGRALRCRLPWTISSIARWPRLRRAELRWISLRYR